MNKEAQRIIDMLGLTPHLEGGFFKQTYSSVQLVERRDHNGMRSMATAIYYLVVGDVANPFHRLKSDELWHFYRGSPLTMYGLKPSGELCQTKLGNNIEDGQVPQVLMEAGTWIGAAVDNPESYALVGCTVSPGFDERDFEFAKRDNLLSEFPQHKGVILKLTR